MDLVTIGCVLVEGIMIMQCCCTETVEAGGTVELETETVELDCPGREKPIGKEKVGRVGCEKDGMREVVEEMGSGVGTVETVGEGAEVDTDEKGTRASPDWIETRRTGTEGRVVWG